MKQREKRKENENEREEVNWIKALLRCDSKM